MDLDDLRRELRARAADPGRTSMPDRLAGVRGKVRTARRRKAAAAGAAVLASVSVLGVAWAHILGGGDQVAGFEPFPDHVNGDRLVEHKYNEGGASHLTWTVTLDGLDMVPRVTCAVPPGAVLPRSDEPVMLTWRIGTRTVSEECASVLPAEVQPAGPMTRADWQQAGVRSGDPFEVGVRLTQGGEEIEAEGVRFGIGFYEKTGDRLYRDGVALPKVVDLEDGQYRLSAGGVKTLPLELAERRRLQLDIPETSGPVAVVYGWQTPLPGASYQVLRDGEPWRSGYGDRLRGPELLDEGAERLTLKVRGSSTDGVLALAVYELDS
jgi:hypothetical protein